MQNYDGTVSGAKFRFYYSCLSAMIDSDEHFAQMVKSAWSLGDHMPPPPQFQVRKGPPLPAPTAKQVHGDIVTWSQEQSAREQADSRVPKMKRVSPPQ